MILNMHLTSEIQKQSKSGSVLAVLHMGYRMPTLHNWFDLGSFWNGLSGRVKQHPFYLVKNSSVHSDLFRCIPLYMLLSSAHPAPLFCGRAKVISK